MPLYWVVISMRITISCVNNIFPYTLGLVSLNVTVEVPGVEDPAALPFLVTKTKNLKYYNN